MRVSMRIVWLGNTANFIEQYRIAQDNGWGGGWQNTLYLAWIDFRRKLKAAR